MSVLDTIISNAELFSKLNPLDCGVMITDKEGTILKYIEGEKFKLNITIGSKVSSQGAIGKCLSTGKQVKMDLAKEIYGVPIRAIATPIFDNNNIVGIISTSTTLLAQETLQEVAQSMAATSQEITATTEEVASSANSLSSNLENLKNSVNDVAEEIKKTDDILRFINSISTNSNLLGLNAAIEAARAGEQGKGFAVVANEIRKMADSSAKSVSDVKNILKNIQDKSSVMIKTINDATILGEHQADATNEIASAIQKLASSAMNLEEVAKIL